MKSRVFELNGYWLGKRSGSTCFHICWYVPDDRRTHRMSARTADLEEAKHALLYFAESANGRSVPRPLGRSSGSRRPLSVMDLLHLYDRRLRQRPQPSSVPPYIIDHWYRFCTREKIVYPFELGLDQQEQYVRWRRYKSRGPLSNATLNRELGVLKAALRDAWRRGHLTAVPHVLGLRNPPPRERFLTAADAKALIDACDAPYLRLFVLLALHTLQRPKAILELQTWQVNLCHRRIDFRKPGVPENVKRRAVVPITESLCQPLDEAIRRSTKGFVIEREGKPLKKVRRSFAAACQRAGLTEVTPYVLRHTGATLLAAAGVPMRQISGMLGHASERSTEIYAKHRPEFLLDAASTLERLFGGATIVTGLARTA